VHARMPRKRAPAGAWPCCWLIGRSLCRVPSTYRRLPVQLGRAGGRYADTNKTFYPLQCNVQGSAREEVHLHTQEILRLVVAGHTAEQSAAPALNPFMRPVVNGKLAPPRSAAVSLVAAASAGARLGTDRAAATAAAGNGAFAANKGSAEAAAGTLGAAGLAQKHPLSDDVNAVSHSAAAAPAMHGGSLGLRAQQLSRAAQAIGGGGGIIEGAAYGGPVGTDTLSGPAATLAAACYSKNLAGAASTLSPKSRPAAASADVSAGADSAAATMVTGTKEAAAADSKEKLWTR